MHQVRSTTLKGLIIHLENCVDKTYSEGVYRSYEHIRISKQPGERWLLGIMESLTIEAFATILCIQKTICCYPTSTLGALGFYHRFRRTVKLLSILNFGSFHFDRLNTHF